MDTERKPVSWGCLPAWLPATLVAVVIGFALFFLGTALSGLGMTWFLRGTKGAEK